MPTPINSSSANQEAYRAQVASSRSEKQLASMTNSLKATEKMATAMGLDTAGIQNTLKTVSASQEPASSSTKVSLSADAVAKSQAERPAQERREAGVLEGWAFDTAHPGEPVELDLRTDDQLVASGVANRYRIDLDRAELAGGRCGFRIGVPPGAGRLGLFRARDGGWLAEV